MTITEAMYRLKDDLELKELYDKKSQLKEIDRAALEQVYNERGLGETDKKEHLNQIPTLRQEVLDMILDEKSGDVAKTHLIRKGLKENDALRIMYYAFNKARISQGPQKKAGIKRIVSIVIIGILLLLGRFLHLSHASLNAFIIIGIVVALAIVVSLVYNLQNPSIQKSYYDNLDSWQKFIDGNAEKLVAN